AGGEPDPTLREWIDGAGIRRVRVPPLEDQRRHEPFSRFSGDALDVELGPDDLAYVAFTSGSTGGSKAIAGRHGPLTHFLPWLKARFGLSADDRYGMLSGLGHDPLHRDIFNPLALGASVHVPDRESFLVPGRLTAWMRERRISILHLTPALSH